MKKLITAMVLMFGTMLAAQQPQAPVGTPLFNVNSTYTNGVAPGYWPTAGSGLTLNISAGTAFCGGVAINYAGSTLTMSNSATNYVYLNTASSCVPASNTSSFASTNIPIAIVVASGGAITSITDARTMFFPPGSGSSGDTITSPNGTLGVGGTTTNTTLDVLGSVGKILAGATPALTFTPILGVDNSNAGTLQTANGSANAHTIWGSAATTSNTILGPAVVIPNGHLAECSTSGTTCTLTDGGAPATGTTITVCSGTITFNPGSTLSNACSSAATGSCSGLATTDDLMVDFNGDPTATTGYVPGAMGTIVKYPTANTVNVKFCNNTGSTIVPTSVTLNFRAVR